MAIKLKTRRKTRLQIKPCKEQCHPKINSRSDTCLERQTIEQIGSSLGSPSGLKGGSLRRWIQKKTRCKTERCWIERAALETNKKEELIRRHFRPTMPESWKDDPDTWLDSNNIADVMKQYEETYPEFKFFGTNPIDFAAPNPYDKDAAAQNKCLEEKICKLNLKDLLKEGKTKLGFVYNLDPSNKGGSHWIASFTDIPGHHTYYFDSYGMKAPPQIARFMRSLTLQDPKMKLSYNARRFQYGNSECGMYSMYFLICMLEGESFKKFCRRAPGDGAMLSLRKCLYSQKDA